MSEPYPDFVARFYDPVYAQVRDGVDNEYYLEAMTSADGPVLEIGVGTGRLFAEALRRGADFFFRFEIEHLIARSPLDLAALHGDFAGGALAADSREYVVVCRREG